MKLEKSCRPLQYVNKLKMIGIKLQDRHSGSENKLGKVSWYSSLILGKKKEKGKKTRG